MYSLLILKRRIEGWIIFPFILLGRLLSYLTPLNKEYNVFYFLPFYHIGGAEKVHLQVVKATGGKDTIVFFTRQSHNQGFYNEFKQTNCEIRDISKYTDNKWLYFLNLIFRGIITGYINQQGHPPVVFNGQCNFGYKISPWLNRRIRQVELIHSLNTFSFIRIPFLPFIHSTVMISKKRIQDHLELYERYHIPKIYTKRIHYISNAISIPERTPEKPADSLTVLYVGRATTEKRAHLFAAISEKMLGYKDITFQMLGDVSESIDQTTYPHIYFWGNQTEERTINSIYASAHVLIIPSETEGFPMVMIEAMANGLAIIATPVGDIPYHLANEISGYLFSSIKDENLIIKEGVEYLERLLKNKILLKEISRHNINYAQQNFDIHNFNVAYQNLIYKSQN